jgi:hypothetical protein
MQQSGAGTVENTSTGCMQTQRSAEQDASFAHLAALRRSGLLNFGSSFGE